MCHTHNYYYRRNTMNKKITAQTDAFHVSSHINSNERGSTMTRIITAISYFMLTAIFAMTAHTIYAQDQTAYVEELVTFNRGDATFSGTLSLPEGSGPHPAVIMISGMGQQDRDWTFVGGKYKMAKGIADHFTRNGIAVLRYDDRGHGVSTGTPEMETGFDDLADDVNAAVTMLRERNDIDEVGLCGHSLGGIIAPFMASKYDNADFIVIISGSFVSGEKIKLDQATTMPNIWRLSKDMTEDECNATGIRMAEHLSKYAESGKGLEVVQDILFKLINWQIDNLTEEQIKENLQYYKDVDEFRQKSYEGAVKYYTSPHQLSFTFHDPAHYISKVRCPLLVLFGDNDKHVTIKQNLKPLMYAMADPQTRDFTVKIIQNADHVYATKDWEVLPEMLDFTTSWIQARVSVDTVLIAGQ